MKITEKQIHDISQDIQAGLVTYLNKDTYEIKSIINLDESFGDTEFWEDELNEIENEWKVYIEIRQMESREAYEIMEEFVYEIKDQRLKGDVIKILNRKSPFANFKAEIETSPYRQKWFDFKDKKYEKYVRDCLEREGIKFEKTPPHNRIDQHDN